MTGLGDWDEADLQRLRASVSRAMVWCGWNSGTTIREVEVLSTGLQEAPRLRALQDPTTAREQQDASCRVRECMEVGTEGFEALLAGLQSYLRMEAMTQRAAVLPSEDGFVDLGLLAAYWAHLLRAIIKDGVVFIGLMDYDGRFCSPPPAANAIRELKRANPGVQCIVVGCINKRESAAVEADATVLSITSHVDLMRLLLSEGDDRLVVEPVDIGVLKVREGGLVV